MRFLLLKFEPFFKVFFLTLRSAFGFTRTRPKSLVNREGGRGRLFQLPGSIEPTNVQNFLASRGEIKKSIQRKRFFSFLHSGRSRSAETFGRNRHHGPQSRYTRGDATSRREIRLRRFQRRGRFSQSPNLPGSKL